MVEATYLPIITADTTFEGRRARIDFPNGHPRCFVCEPQPFFSVQNGCAKYRATKSRFHTSFEMFDLLRIESLNRNHGKVTAVGNLVGAQFSCKFS